MRVSVVQTAPVFGHPHDNIRQALELMRPVEADLYVLPELFASGYNFMSDAEVEKLADPIGEGRTFDAIKDFADERKCFVVYGFPERAEDQIFNSACIVGHDGTLGCYRKIHLFDREKLFFHPGDRPFEVYDTPVGKIGIMICFDWYYPEAARSLALKGAQIIAHPSNLVLPHCPDSMPVRCRENRVYAATANRVGTENRGGHALTYIGQSQITAPNGHILHRASPTSPEIAVADVDLSATNDKHVTALNDLFEDRREELYGG